MNPDDQGSAFASPHQSVLYQEVLEALAPHSAGRYVDGTVGAGGHAAGILAASAPDGLLLGLDVDPGALELAQHRLAEFGERAILRHGSYGDLAQHLATLGWPSVDGILLDIGASSMQFDRAERGFSFQQEGPLDMRFDPQSSPSAADLVNDLPDDELADILFRYGEERKSRRVARAIANARPLQTTGELAAVVARALGGQRSRIHPATRTFQALRIAVNGELDTLEASLPQAIEALASGGRLAVIAFHSLEDRIVKRYFRRGEEVGLKEITRRPLVASEEEAKTNPRSRSAKLRVAEKI